MAVVFVAQELPFAALAQANVTRELLAGQLDAVAVSRRMACARAGADQRRL
jgi:hypothetical protein